MTCGPVRFRVILPIIFGFLAATLMLWDYENNRKVVLMGMSWDIGPPVWPYQAVHSILFAVNAPAFVLSLPILKLLNLKTNSLEYFIWFPAIVAWWYWTGTRIDFGVLGRRSYGHAKPLAIALALAALVPLYIAGSVTLDEIRWWMAYGKNSTYLGLTLLRTVGPVLWCLVVAVGCIAAAMQLLRNKAVPAAMNPPKHRAFVTCAVMIPVFVFAIHRWDKALNPPFNYDECEVDRLYGLGCVHGIVVEESGNPIGHIEVNLIPSDKTGDARWQGTKSEWTDEQGRYNFNRVKPGEYVLGANTFTASAGPDAERPFATEYYPNAADELDAGVVKIDRSSPRYVSPLRLRKLQVATIKINVLWPDGTRPARSNLYFHNILYPRGGGTLPQIDDGLGVFTLPKSFEYDAVASVDCDAGKVIESRESRPVQRVRIEDGSTPPEMTFVIPGPACKLR